MKIENSIIGKWALAINDDESDKLYIREIGRSSPSPGVHRVEARDLYVLQYVVEGKVLFNGQHVSAGNGFLIFPGDEVVFEIEENVTLEHYWIIFGGADVPDILKNCGIEAQSHVFPAAFFEKVHKDFEYVLSSHRSDDNIQFDYPLMMHSVFYKLLAYHSATLKIPSEKQKSNYVEAAVEFIKLHYSEHIDVEDIASAVHVSSRYMYKLFMRELGRSPKQILTEHRINRAAHLLTTTEISIKEIAHRVGYSEQGQLSKVFRQVYGVSPYAYRTKP